MLLLRFRRKGKKCFIAFAEDNLGGMGGGVHQHVNFSIFRKNYELAMTNINPIYLVENP